MGTSAGFVPAAVPECPYAPRMTRAQAIALAAAGGLLENCVVVVTDGPTIGVPGFTSATEIELNPVSPTELGQTARVHQGYTNEAWAGLYDINLGAGSIIRLTDNRNNTAFDTDANAPTVQTQVPWGQGTNLQFRDNTFEDSTMTWVVPFTAGFNFTDNTVADAVLDFTGMTTNFVAINGSEFRTAKAVIAPTSTSALTISKLKLDSTSTATAALTIVPTGTGSVSMSSSEIRAGYLFTASHSLGAVTVSDSSLRGNGGVATLAAATTINDSTIIVGNLNIQTGTSNSNSISRSTLNTTNVTKTTGSTGVLNIQNSTITNATVTIGAANGATTNTFSNIDVQTGLFTLNGPIAGGGRNDFTNGAKFGGANIVVAATATAGIGINNGWIEGATITQNRSAGTGSTTLFDCQLRGFATFTDNGTVDPGVGLSFSRVTAVDSTITVGNVTGKTGSGTVLQQADLIGSTLTLVGPNGPASATDFLDKLRMHGCSLSNAGFGCSDVIIDGNFTKTFTAYNLNRLVNKGFDDIL